MLILLATATATAAVVVSGLSPAHATPVLAEDGDAAGALAAEAAAAIVDQPSFVTGRRSLSWLRQRR